VYKEKGGHKTPLCVFQPNATGFSTFQPLRGTVVAQQQVRPVPRKDFFYAQNECCGEGMMAGNEYVWGLDLRPVNKSFV